MSEDAERFSSLETTTLRENAVAKGGGVVENGEKLHTLSPQLLSSGDGFDGSNQVSLCATKRRDFDDILKVFRSLSPSFFALIEDRRSEL